MPEPNSGCWFWLGSLVSPDSYGQFYFQGKIWLAHRASFVMHVSEIPEGLRVCHSCDMPCCVNPDHLWLGTDKENTHDAIAKGRMTQSIPKRLKQGIPEQRILTDRDIEAIRDDLGRRLKMLTRKYRTDPASVAAVMRALSSETIH